MSSGYDPSGGVPDQPSGAVRVVITADSGASGEDLDEFVERLRLAIRARGGSIEIVPCEPKKEETK